MSFAQASRTARLAVGTRAPYALLNAQLSILCQELPLVFDGQAAAIRTARIATRRIRELLPLLGDGARRAPAARVRRRFRKMGRCLGRVRDADVRLELLASLEQRLPRAAHTLIRLQQEGTRERLELVRTLVERLERLDAIDLVTPERPRPFSLIRGPSGRQAKPLRQLHGTQANRAYQALQAIERATGVYFPDRLHAARVAIKKLRYTLEIVHDLRQADLTDALDELKTAQDLLGELHDRQVLADHVSTDRDHAVPGEHALIRQVLDAEVQQLHGRYLEQRPRLLAICRERMQGTPPRRIVARLLMVSLTFSALLTFLATYFASRASGRLRSRERTRKVPQDTGRPLVVDVPFERRQSIKVTSDTRPGRSAVRP